MDSTMFDRARLWYWSHNRSDIVLGVFNNHCRSNSRHFRSYRHYVFADAPRKRLRKIGCRGRETLSAMPEDSY